MFFDEASEVTPYGEILGGEASSERYVFPDTRKSREVHTAFLVQIEKRGFLREVCLLGYL